MKTFLSSLALAAALAGAAAAQPSGGPDAKGNAPLKPGHTVNDGAPKPGRNSFTEGQARTHIEKAGFTGVSPLVKGDDGVWRGHAMRDGQPTDVALDFKGNVSTPTTAGPGGPPSVAGMAPPPMRPAPATAGDEATTTRTEHAAMRHHTRRHRRHHHHGACANPSTTGAACSGVDKDGNGVSDREDRAISRGAHP